MNLADTLWSQSESQPYTTISDDTRPVLRDSLRYIFHSAGERSRPQSARTQGRAGWTISFDHELPPQLLEYEKLLIVPRARKSAQWKVMEPFVIPAPQGSEKNIAFAVDVPFAPEQAVWLTVYPLMKSPRRGSLKVEVPSEATLEFATGVLESWQRIGPVRFLIEACTQGACKPLFDETVQSRGRRKSAIGWVDRRVSLAPYAGKEIELQFSAMAADEDKRVPVAFFADPVLRPTSAAKTNGPNLLLISIDTLRPDHLGTYGYGRPTSPYLDRFFEENGTVFEHCVSASSSTLPSHMTMMTSLTPAVHGARNTKPNHLPHRSVLLAEQLRRHGFATAAVTENGAIARSRGFGRGFETYREKRHKESPFHQRTIEETFRDGLNLVRQRKDERFFIFLHTYKPHNPYLPPEGYRDLFGSVDPGFKKSKQRPGWTPLQYDREIRYVDDQVRTLFETLESEGLLENTIVAFTSDHGEAFLEHGFFAHGAIVYEEVLKVPLLLSGPGIPRGQRVEEPVGLLDLMPSMLDLLGVELPKGLMGQSFRTLLVDGKAKPNDLDPDRAALEWETRPIFSEASIQRAVRSSRNTTILQPTYAVRDGELKLIRFRTLDGPKHRLYNLVQDPGEKSDLYDEKDPVSQRMKKLVEDYVASAKILRDSLEASEAEETDALSPEETDMLRALGYLE